jgi:hypothetical protein
MERLSGMMNYSRPKLDSRPKLGQGHGAAGWSRRSVQGGQAGLVWGLAGYCRARTAVQYQKRPLTCAWGRLDVRAMDYSTLKDFAGPVATVIAALSAVM